MRPFTPIEQRFWPKVTKAGPDECWIWKGAASGRGYGRISLGGAGSPLLFAHRYSFEVHCGPIPEGYHVCHRCDTPACVNPAHLFAAPPKENSADMIRKGRGYWPAQVLDEHKVRRVRALRAKNWTQKAIAREIGVSKFTVQSVLSGKTWAHVA